MAGPPKKLPDDRDYIAELKIERLQASIKLRKKQSYWLYFNLKVFVAS